MKILVFYFFKKEKLVLLLAFVFLFSTFGVLRFHYLDSKQPKNVFDELVGEEISFEGSILEEVDRRENNQRMIVGFRGVRILVTTELYPEFSYGDRVFVSGDLSKPKKMNPF